MPLPLVPMARLALRIGAVAAAAFAAKRALTPRVHAGRTDQRAEDALDEMDEGLALHRPSDPAQAATRQTNTAWRIKRVIRWEKGGIEVDAALLSRFRVRRISE